MAKSGEKNRVIIVDDDEDLLRLLLSAFKGEGFDVHGITNGKDALDYLLEESNVESAALIILDRMLPDMDGLDILKKFKAKSQSHVPILILSVLSAEKDVIEGIKRGAVDYIAKPFSLPVLLQKAHSLIAR